MTSGDEKPTRRRRRRRRGGRRPGGEAPRSAEAKGEPRRPKKKRRPPAERQPPVEPRAPELFADVESNPPVRWGDDSDAPTPAVELAPDLPADPPLDDPDPLSAELDDLEGDGAEALEQRVADVAGIRFAAAGKIYSYDAAGRSYRVGDAVTVEGDRGHRLGTVAVAPRRRAVDRKLRRILRPQSASDRRSRERAVERGHEALAVAKERARELELGVKLFRGEYNGSGSKLTLYFSCEDKVDSRPLMRALASELGVRVELRQIGVRDQAKMVGGIGSCGRELCCTTWLPAFVPVSIKNAKDQGLVLNPSKVSGQCGRLKCCLVYEQSTYAELRKGLPKLGKRVIAAESEGRVVEVDVLKRRIRVNHGDGRVELYEADQVEPMFPSQKPNPPQKKKKVPPGRKPQAPGGTEKRSTAPRSRRRRPPGSSEDPK